MSSATILTRRQNMNNNDGIDGDGEYPFTDAGYATRYAITAAVIFAILIYFVGGYLHGKVRLNKNKPLLGYHRVSTFAVSVPSF